MARMRYLPQGGALRESPFVDRPPELRCVATARATGQRCKAIRVRGHNCCRMHGGAVVAVRRCREELAAIVAHRRRGKPRAGRLEWLVQRLARADQNRPRAYSAQHERTYATDAEDLMREVSAKGATALARAVHSAAVAIRPYRPVDCLILSARLVLAWVETRHDVERLMLVQEFIGAFGVDQAERQHCEAKLAAVLGARSVRSARSD
jgi:hypothetical protein